MHFKKKHFGKKIAYVLGTYPYLTTTFIDREIMAIEKKRKNIILIAIRKPAPFETNHEMQKLKKHIKYILPVSWIPFLKINIILIVLNPIKYFGLLFFLLSRHHKTAIDRLKTLFHFFEGTYAVELIRRNSVRHIHAHFADRAAVVAMVAARFLKITYSLTAHANDIYVSPIMLKEKIRNAKFVTTCTSYNKKYLEHLTGQRIELVYHGIDLKDLKLYGIKKSNKKPVLILSVGQLKEKKGFPFLIKACHLLKKRGYNFICEIIGEGPERSNLEKLIYDFSLEDTVILSGSVSNKKVLDRYQYATIFVLSCIPAKNNDRDGIPNVLIEAMGCQVPVISTKFSGIPEIIEDGVNGLLVDPANEKALADAMSGLLDNARIQKKIAQNGRITIEKKFDINKNIEQLLKLFNQT